MEPQNCSVISPFRASDGVPGTATRRRNGRSRVQIPVKERYFYVLDNVHISFVAHLVSYSMDSGDSFRRVKRPGPEVNHLLSYSAEVKNEWSHTATTVICLCSGQGQLSCKR